VAFDPETGDRRVVASSLEEWAQQLLADFELMTAYPLAEAWQKQFGPLPLRKRLIPKIPFVLGGDFVVEIFTPWTRARDAGSGGAGRPDPRSSGWCAGELSRRGPTAGEFIRRTPPQGSRSAKAVSGCSEDLSRALQECARVWEHQDAIPRLGHVEVLRSSHIPGRYQCCPGRQTEARTALREARRRL
jgi:hypothetical protein